MDSLGPRRWDCFMVGMLVLSLGIVAQANCKIMQNEFSAKLHSDSIDLSRGNLPVSGFAAFIHQQKREKESENILWCSVFGIGGIFLGCILMAVGLMRKTVKENDIERQACPECGELIAVSARVCRFCNAMIRPEERPRRRFNQ
jgi:hypothetical protein